MSATWQWAKANPDAAARRIRELERENAALRVALQEIADASGFDNIGNWARNKAKDALRKKAQP